MPNVFNNLVALIRWSAADRIEGLNIITYHLNEILYHRYSLVFCISFLFKF